MNLFLCMKVTVYEKPNDMCLGVLVYASCLKSICNTTLFKRNGLLYERIKNYIKN